MARYIDADALKEMFPDNGEGSWTYNVTVKACIDAQPTAFDLDKVVQELEEVERFNEEKEKEAYEDEDWEKYDFYIGMNRGIGRAICIVRNGGKE